MWDERTLVPQRGPTLPSPVTGVRAPMSGTWQIDKQAQGASGLGAGGLKCALPTLFVTDTVTHGKESRRMASLRLAP